MLTLPKNIENICRLCLTESVDGSDMLPLFPVRGGNPNGPNTVVSKILQCTTVKIEHYQGAPTTICEYCSARLEDWQSFREQCVGTDEYLKATYRHIFNPEEAMAEAFIKQQALQQEQQRQQQQKLQKKQQQELFEEMTELPPAEDENGSYLIGEEINPEDMMEQQDDQFYDMYDDEDDQDEQDDQQDSEWVQQMNRRNGIRVPKWSKEFGAKLNSLLHVVGGERPHQCKVCRKRFLRRPHCRRHVAQAHAVVIDSVKLPKNWEMIARRRFIFSKAPIQRVMEPVPAPPAPREDHYEPTLERPHQCEVCKKCFKRSQHLRRHRTSHLQIEIDRSEIMRGIHEQQRAQEQLETLISHPEESVEKEPANQDDDIIALSDDDEDMGEEISPEEFIGQYDGSNDDISHVTGPDSKRPRLSDIPHIFYGTEDEYDEDDASQYITKNGTIRKRAPPLAKIPGERPYECRHCKKTFKRSDHLKSHLKTHSAETDYRCDWCQKGFRYRQNYLIHMKNKTCFGDRGPLRGHPMPKLMPKPGIKATASDDEVVLGD